ncbi:MAG: hypothetical protein R3E83_17185 [Burkholderiaceae bacterium]
MNESASTEPRQRSFWELLWRYFSFVWMFEEVPARADRFVLAAVVRANRSRGLRYLPCYMRRYLRLSVFSGMMAWACEALAGPVLVTGSLFTCSSIAFVGLLVALVGYGAMRLRAFEYARW